MFKTLKRKLIRLFKRPRKLTMAELTAESEAQWPNTMYTMHDYRTGSSVVYQYPANKGIVK